MFIDEIDVWGIVWRTITIPNNPQKLSQYKKRVAKVNLIILDSMKEYKIPHIVGKSTKRIFGELKTLY